MLITDLSQIWKQYPVNYNSKTHELTWAYSKLSDMYNKVYKERLRKVYIDMQKEILNDLFSSLDESFIRYTKTKKGVFLDSYICSIYIEMPLQTKYSSREVRSSPIIPLYKEGLLQNRSDICKASNESVCIKYIHTNELGPPRYRVCWNVPASKDPTLLPLIRSNVDSGKWNLLKEDSSTTLCILEQY